MSDELVRVLSKGGYQPIFLPRTGVQPPEVYGVVEKRLVRHGPLQSYVRGAADLQRKTGHLPEIEAHRTSKKGANASAKFLLRALSCIGVDGLRADLGLDSSEKLTFSFVDVTFEMVEPADIQRLFTQTLRVQFPRHLLRTGTAHVVYEYLFARRLRIVRERSQNTAFTLGASLTKELEGAISVTNESDSSFVLSSPNPIHAAFAFRAGLVLEEGSSLAFYPEVTKALMGGEDAGLTPYMPFRGMVAPVVDDRLTPANG